MCLQNKDAERTGQVTRPLSIDPRDHGVQRLAVLCRNDFKTIPESVLEGDRRAMTGDYDGSFADVGGVRDAVDGRMLSIL